jgi:hypothetical protein
MARNTHDARAAREKKQKIFLAVGAVVFLALAVIQGPKLWKQINPPAAETAAPVTAPNTSAAPTGTTAPAVSTPRVRAPKSQRAQLAGVLIVPEQPVAAGEGQLDSFSRFATKDPFVQQIATEPLPTPEQVASAGQGAASTVRPAAGKPQGVVQTSLPGTGIPTVGTGTALPQPAATMAMLRVNGKLQAVELKKRFPSSDKAFVLRSLKPGSATIAVADGSFAGGAPTLTLRLGRPVTLVNTATGVRYVLRLVYVGADAANVTGFSAK